VRRNKGSAGVDAQTLAEVERHGVDRFVEEIGTELRAGRYRPRAVLRRYIPKADGKKRPLGIPTVRDRVVQKAATLVLEPIFEADFHPCSYGVWTKRCGHLGTLVRYADDFVVLCDTTKACEEAEDRVRKILGRLGLELHPDKTRRVDLSRGKEGFDFLGCHLRKRMSGPIWERQRKRVYFLQRWPSRRSMKRVRQRVKELTGRSRNGVKDIRVLIRDLNPVLRGWGNYFRTGNAAQKFIQIDTYAWWRLQRFMVKRKGRNLRPDDKHRWTRDFFHALGLHRLRGTIQYPEAA